MATGDLHTKFCVDWSSGSQDMLTDRQTDRHTDAQTAGLITIFKSLPGRSN